MADDKGLSLIQKIKLILGAKKVAEDVKNAIPDTPAAKGVWSKLDGTKSITGLLMIIAYYVGPQFGVKVPDIFLQIGTLWAGVGFAHKFTKATGILSAVMTALNAVNKKDTINGDKK